LIQQQQDGIDRNFRLSDAIPVDGTFTIAQDAATRANLALGFDASGDLVPAAFFDPTLINQTDLDQRHDVTFATVAAMVAASPVDVAGNAVTPQVGATLRTQGYYTAGDGGDNSYLVVAAATGTDDGGSFLDLTSHQAKAVFHGGEVFSKQFGAKADGATDDRTGLFNANAFGPFTLSSGTHLVNSALTLSANVKFSSGAILKPAAATTVAVSGDIDAGEYQIFDLTNATSAMSGLRGCKVSWFGGTVGSDLKTPLINAHAALNAGEITVQQGGFTLTGNVTVTKDSVVIIGRGKKGGTVIDVNYDTAAADGIVFDTCNNSGLRNIQFLNTVTKTAGAIINLDNCHNTKLTDFRIDGEAYNAVTLSGGALQFIDILDDFEIGAGSNAGILIDSAVAGDFAQEVFMANAVIAPPGDGVKIVNGSGIYMSNVSILGAGGIGMHIAPPAGKRAKAIRCDTVLCDTCTGTGWSVNPTGTGFVVGLELSNCWGNSNDRGFQTGTTGVINGVTISGGSWSNNAKDGIGILSGTNYKIIGGAEVFTNSTDGSALFDGIVFAAGISGFIVSDIACGSGGEFPTNNQRYGIVVNTGASDRYIIADNLVTGNVTTDVIDAGTGANKRVANNY